MAVIIDPSYRLSRIRLIYLKVRKGPQRQYSVTTSMCVKVHVYMSLSLIIMRPIVFLSLCTQHIECRNTHGFFFKMPEIYFYAFLFGHN